MMWWPAAARWGRPPPAARQAARTARTAAGCRTCRGGRTHCSRRRAGCGASLLQCCSVGEEGSACALGAATAAVVRPAPLQTAAAALAPPLPSPLRAAVQGPFILIQELCERLSYNGIATNVGGSAEASRAAPARDGLLAISHTPPCVCSRPLTSAADSDLHQGRAAHELQQRGHAHPGVVRHLLPHPPAGRLPRRRLPGPLRGARARVGGRAVCWLAGCSRVGFEGARGGGGGTHPPSHPPRTLPRRSSCSSLWPSTWWAWSASRSPPRCPA